MAIAHKLHIFKLDSIYNYSQACFSDHLYQVRSIALCDLNFNFLSHFVLNLLNLYLAPTCLNRPYFSVLFEGHIRQVWLYKEHYCHYGKKKVHYMHVGAIVNQFAYLFTFWDNTQYIYTYLNFVLLSIM
jgi:hypothetical protein